MEIAMLTNKIVLHWRDRQNRQNSLPIDELLFRRYIIELAEDEKFDIVFNVYYTVGNITHKLDYYNLPTENYSGHKRGNLSDAAFGG